MTYAQRWRSRAEVTVTELSRAVAGVLGRGRGQESLEDPSQALNVGIRGTSNGYQESWAGYKMHFGVIDEGVVVGCLLMSASLHDRQAAPPWRS